MLYKARTESIELQILRSLNSRMVLSDKEKQHYLNLKKGYEGELMFDALTEKLQCDCFILNDLLLKMNQTIFQIDTIIIFPETIYLFEVKNFEGDFYYEGDRLYKNPKSEISNPLVQLSRSESLFRRLLHHYGFDITIDASVVFINSEFTLYQTPLNKPLIFPTQLNRYIKKLNTTSLKFNKKHTILAEQLVSLHILDSPYKQLPCYDYDHLQKGITCANCNSLSISIKRTHCVCRECGFEEVTTNTIMRSIEEFKLLFPNRKVTTNVIHDWCKIIESKKRIHRVLEKNYKIVGSNRWSFYEETTLDHDTL
jgi:Nuclease-related domain